MAVVQFDDEDLAAGLARGELSLIGWLIRAPPPLYALRMMLGRVWRYKGDLTISAVDEGLTQFLFSLKADLYKAVTKSPWIFDNFMLVLARWEDPSPEVAERLCWAPMAVQLWKVPFECFIEKMAWRLGSSIGVLNDSPTLHRSDVSGGLYIRAAPVLDLIAPLPDVITAGDVDLARGNFVASVKIEKVPHFFFLCGVIGHIGENCPRKEAMAGATPKYGVFSVATESGSPMTEDTLSKRSRRFTWIRAAKTRSSPSRNSGSFKEPPPRQALPQLLASQEGGVAGEWRDTRRPSPRLMGADLQALAITPSNSGPSDEVATQLAEDATMTEGAVPNSSSPAAKRARSGPETAETISFLHGKVVASSLSWAQPHP
ncbi:unnamed protein product [Linum trigynum]|uniref:DUF4283 domain-containing protein n=1 Tax=Linum trigynum TaxID=586398 RepID=A0AAV2EAQ9_9ROSI